MRSYLVIFDEREFIEIEGNREGVWAGDCVTR